VAPAAPRPPGLVLVAAVTAVEGLSLAAFGTWLGVESRVARAADDRMAAGSAVYFLVLGPLVLLVAWALWRRQGWAMGAALFVQLLALPVAWTMAQGGLLVAALPLAAAAVAGVVVLLQPGTRHALGRD
jgi:hypothetical protein